MRRSCTVPLWLIGRLTPSRHREALLGDLTEELAAGRSNAWLWREVLAALLAIRFAWKPYVLAALKAAVIAMGLSVMAAGTLSWAQNLQRSCDAVEACPH